MIFFTNDDKISFFTFILIKIINFIIILLK
jgi:hypothetical protein